MTNSGSSSSSCKATAVRLVVSSVFDFRLCMTREVRLQNSFLRLFMAREKECPIEAFVLI